VGAYIGAAYWFTSSTSFANPAITIGRMFSDTFVGIAPASVLSFIGAQIIGGALAIAIIKALYPAITPAEAAGIIVPHGNDATAEPARAAHDGISPSAGQQAGPARSG
jgi:glycerol uptake facilitator-like aquaporin